MSAPSGRPGPAPLLTLKTKYKYPRFVASSEDGRWVAVAHGGAEHKQVRPALTVFDVHNPRKPYVLRELHPPAQRHTDTRGVYGLRFVDGQLLYLEEFDAGLGIYEPYHLRYCLWQQPGGPTETLLSWRNNGRGVVLYEPLPPTGPVLLTPELHPQVFDLGRREVLATLPFNELLRQQLSYSYRGWWVADCDGEHAFWHEHPPRWEEAHTRGIVYRYHLASMQVVQEYWLPIEEVDGRAVTVQPGHFFATPTYCGCYSFDGVYLWHKASAEPVAGEHFNRFRWGGKYACISPDETRVAVTRDHWFFLYDLQTGAELVWDGRYGFVGAMAFSADSSQLALLGRDGVFILPVP